MRDLPSVDALLRQPTIATLVDEYARPEVVCAVRLVLEEQRQNIRDGHAAGVEIHRLALAVRDKLYARARPNLRRIINATGIVLHTGLGRAPLADEAVSAMADVAAGYCNLEFDLETGQRGDRHAHVRELLRELTGGEDALVVNNNAAATYLALHTLATGREAIVSRGQLVEIGGSYRMPDIMAAAGCRMVEVGTTNRTRIGDYERALSENTAVLLRVHTSNFRVVGFTESAPLAEMVELARRQQDRTIAVIDDLGSGLLDATIDWPADYTVAGEDESAPGESLDSQSPPAASVQARESGSEPQEGETPPSPGQWNEPTVRDSLAAGADLVLFSGDKLLGGPQAGLAVGRRRVIEAMRRNPLMRAFRPDKLTLAALDATLRLYRDPATLHRRLPVYRLLSASLGTLEGVGRRLAQQIVEMLPSASVSAQRDTSFAGGGSLPGIAFPTCVVRVRLAGVNSTQLAASLRRRDVPVICRLHEDALVFDCRTLLAEDAEQIVAALADGAREAGGE